VTPYGAGQGTIFFERKKPTATVVIPSVGRSTISRTLQSLLAMRNPLWCALVGFDGLTEDKVQVLNLPKDPRITYLFLPKAGGGSNHGGQVRNLLMEKAETEWICFLDDDDTFRPDYLDHLTEEQERHPEARTILFRMSYDPSDRKVLPPLTIRQPIVNNVGISFAVKKLLCQEQGLRFQNGATEDFYFLKSIADKGEEIVFSEHITYNIRF
jgi:cellulose synthase/poly-beta-1,6-N-acetylglucosamine synthase-like glycosyltransferase